MDADERFMRAALRLGERGLGRTRPNPPVGAVVVRGGRIVGRGFHRRAGAPHAEVEAIRDAGREARGGTLYVTLEPCAHHGRTPPCVEAVLAAGIASVVIGTTDPNPRVSGRGAERLRAAGLAVRVGVRERAARRLIEAFARHAARGIPFVTLKLAASLDGRIATRSGDSRWISGETSRRLVHRWRDEMDAILVGAGTVMADDPRLTCRRPGGRDPLRIVVDGRLRCPPAARVLSPPLATGTWLATLRRRGPVLRELRRRGVTMIELPGRRGRLALADLLAALGERDVTSVLIEGGADLAATALREQIVDRLAIFYAPRLIGDDGRPMLGALGVDRLAQALRAHHLRTRRIGDDILVEAALSDAAVV